MTSLLRLVLAIGLIANALPAFAGNLKVDLSPAQAVTAGARWRVDSGAWQTSGTTLKSLSNGTHVVTYNSITGWIAPGAASVTIGGGTTTITGTYVQAASLVVNLTGGIGQWRVDGGAWLAGGMSVGQLAPGNHTVDYAPVAGYVAPVTETAVLTAGQTLTRTRSYSVQPGSLVVNLGGGIGQWRVDGGTWLAGGTTAGSLAPGSHTIDYAPVAGYVAPATETAALTAGQTLTLTRSYAVQPASLVINLAGGIGQWRVDGGAWLTGGTTAGQLTPGSHTIDYAPVVGYVAPTTETATLTAGQTLTLARDYYVPASLTVTVTRYGAPSGDQWRIFGGTWQPSGATVSNLRPGITSLEFASLPGYFSLGNPSLTLVAGSNVRNFTYIPQCYVTVTLAPGTGSWRLNGGTWMASGSTLGPIYPGNLPLEYSAVAGYTAPPSESVDLRGGARTLTRPYIGPASLTLGLSGGVGQWRLDGGAWNAGGATLSNLAPGSHSVEYAPVGGYLAPTSESLVFRADESRNLTRRYLPSGTYLNVVTEPAFAMESGAAKWRIDGGGWNAAGSPVAVPAGTHTLEFQPGAGWDVPPASSVDVSAGAVSSVTGIYFHLHRLRFFIQDDLAAGLTTQQLRDRLSQYAAHIQTIFHRETFRHFTFNPVDDITVVTASPFSGNSYGALPNVGFEMWVHARLTDNPTYGSYGGYASIDVTGAGGAAGMKWSAVYDLATLVPGSPEAWDAHTQLYTLLHEFEHSFGAGLGEYYSLSNMSDPTGTAPVFPTTAFTTPGDLFWAARPEFWGDPLCGMIYGQPMFGSPTDMAQIIDLTRFAPGSVGVINGYHRSPERDLDAVPALYDVRVRVVAAGTGAPIPGATVRVWNRHNPGTYGDFEAAVSATSDPAEFRFRWSTSITNYVFSNSDNAKIVKVWAPGYAAKAQWTTIYEAQKTKTIDGSDLFVITVELTPAP